MALSSPLTVVGLMNGMIGGLILVLPVAAYQSGYIFTVLATFVAGAFSFYSCYLSIKHLGDQKDMNFAMFAHFNNSQIAKIAYDLVVWLGLFFGSMFYYGLICIQWENIVNSQSIAIPLGNTALLFCLIFVLKYLDLGEVLMAYGIISIFSYLIFLIWVIATAPSGNNDFQPVGTNLYNFAATMSLAFAIQAFFIPVLKKNPKQDKHIFFTFLAYIIGACIYIYIAFMGSFGIINRIPVTNNTQTIQSYFRPGNVQLIIIQSIYLIHLYSCLPEFVLISKKRLFNMFKIRQTKKGKIPIPQIIYSAIFLGVTLLIRLLGVKIDTIITINGAIVGFFNIYFFPALIHLKCLYLGKNRISTQQNDNRVQLQDNSTPKPVLLELRNTHVSNNLQNNAQKLQKQIKSPFLNQNEEVQTSNPYKNQLESTVKELKDKENKSQKLNILQTQDEPREFYVCNCKRSKYLLLQIGQVILVLIMVVIGAAVMVNGLISIV